MTVVKFDDTDHVLHEGQPNRVSGRSSGLCFGGAMKIFLRSLHLNSIENR